MRLLLPTAVPSLTLLLSVFGFTPALAAWSPSGVTIKDTNASIPLVEACTDGSTGTFVVWQEESSPGQGVLRAQHLLGSGDLDPTWPASGALVTGTVQDRKMLGALPDRLGGFYVWWKESNTLLITRVDSNGQVAAGWPAAGRALDSVGPYSRTVSVIEDGANGIYAAWAPSVGPAARAIHLGPTNTGAGGWPNSNLVIATALEVPTAVFWPRLTLAPDGGVFAGWASWSTDTTVVPSTFRLRRLTSAGSNASGWPASGLTIGTFRLWEVDELFVPAYALFDLSPDGRGGVFFVTGSLVGTNGGGRYYVENRLYRRQADGPTAADWPDEGRIPSMPEEVPSCSGTNCDQYDLFEYQVVPDGVDGVFAGAGWFADHGAGVILYRYLASGQLDGNASVGGNYEGFSMIPTGDGGAFNATFSANGKRGPFDDDAYLNVVQTPPPSGRLNWWEIHSEIYTHWFGDIALAPLNGAPNPPAVVFFWSQANQRFGLFARAFTTLGEVTAVPEVRSPLALSRVWFDAHAGIRASAFLPSGVAAKFEVFDITGRRVATERAASSGSTEITAHGTVGLPSGLYFARISDSAASASARVVVTH